MGMDKIVAMFGADDSEFQRKVKGMASSAGALGDKLSKSVKSVEGIAKGGAAAVVIKEIGGFFLNASENARIMRDELIKAGKEVPALVNAAASVADSWEKSKKNISEFSGNVLGKGIQGIERITALFATGFDWEQSSIVLASMEAEKRLTVAAEMAAKIRGEAKDINKKTDETVTKNEFDSLNDITKQYRLEKSVEETKKKQNELDAEASKLLKENIGLDNTTEAGGKRAAEIKIRMAQIDLETAKNRAKIVNDSEAARKLAESNEKEFQDSKKKTADELKKTEDKRADDLKKLADREDEFAMSQLTDTEKLASLKASLAEIEENGDLTNIDNQNTILDIKKEIYALTKAAADSEQAKEKELAALQKQRIMNRVTDEQKLNQVIKEGRELQAKINSGKGTTDDKIALEKLRIEYENLKKGIGKSSGDKKDNLAEFRSEDGKIRRGNVVISDEDRKRTIGTSLRNAKLKEEAEKKGRIGKDDKKTPKSTEEYLKEIAEALKEKDAK